MHCWENTCEYQAKTWVFFKSLTHIDLDYVKTWQRISHVRPYKDSQSSWDGFIILFVLEFLKSLFHFSGLSSPQLIYIIIQSKNLTIQGLEKLGFDNSSGKRENIKRKKGLITVLIKKQIKFFSFSRSNFTMQKLMRKMS